MKNNKRDRKNNTQDLNRQNRQYNQEFAKANNSIRNQYDEEFGVEGAFGKNRTGRNTRNANIRGQRDVMNLECADDNEFKKLRKNDKNNVEFAKDNQIDDCDDCCEDCKNDNECDCE